MKNYYHLFANGSDARNFISCEADYIYQFNLVGICTLITGADVLAFSIEDTHLHALLHGTSDECTKFKCAYETSTARHICGTRGSRDNVALNCSLYLIEDDKYLMNAASYIIVQPTKDGKKVMPYDYRWGTGSMYFRSETHIPIWLVGEYGRLATPYRFDSLAYREKKKIAGSRISQIPGEWLCCNGLILPSNYVNVQLFESIFGTPNCFRVFCSAGKRMLDTVVDEMAKIRGITIEDIEARQICKDICIILFRKESSRHLSTSQRITLARELWKKYQMSTRQISTLCRLPEEELSKYL